MRIIYFITLILFCFSAGNIFAQDTLPNFTVKNAKGKISVIWQNKYKEEVKGISIQRSYDSSKNFSSVTTVNNPNDIVNGFIDLHAPYAKMYYRLFIVFDSGVYFFTASHRPDIDPSFDFNKAVKKIRDANEVKPDTVAAKEKDTLKTVPFPLKKGRKTKNRQTEKDKKSKVQKTEEVQVEPAPVPKKEEFPFPSKRIYTGKDNNIVINLPDYKENKYDVKFYDEENKLLFGLNKINDSLLIMEKVNLFHSGWFFFEIYENETLLEKNKFFIPRD